MNKFVTSVLLFIFSIGATIILPFPTFVILVNKWAMWVEKNMKAILKEI